MDIINYVVDGKRMFVIDYKNTTIVVSRSILFTKFSKRDFTIGLRNVLDNFDKIKEELNVTPTVSNIETWTLDRVYKYCLQETPIIKPIKDSDTYKRLNSEDYLHYYLFSDKCIAFIWDSREIVNLFSSELINLDECEVPNDSYIKLHTGFISSNNIRVATKLVGLLDTEELYEQSNLVTLIEEITIDHEIVKHTQELITS